MNTSWKLRLALALMVAALLAVSVPAFAAGTHTVTGTFEINDKAPEKPFTFSLYKVGDFGEKDGKVTLDLLPKILEKVPEAALDLNALDRDNFETDEKWQDAWLEKADLIAKSGVLEDGDKACQDEETDSNGSFTFSPVENGLYLLVSNTDPLVIPDEAEGMKTFWYPKPMLVMVLDKDVKLVVKPLEEKVRFYTVIKSWEGDSSNSKNRPKEIKVNIYYNYKTGSKNEPVETVTLNDSNKWCYSWSTDKEPYKGKDEAPYTVEEVMTDTVKKSYTPKITESIDKENITKRFSITNKYNPSEKKPSSKVKTGDTNKMTKYYVIGAAALIVLIVLFIASRKRRNDDGQA